MRIVLLVIASLLCASSAAAADGVSDRDPARALERIVARAG